MTKDLLCCISFGHWRFLPLEFPANINRKTLKLTGDETIEIAGLQSITPGGMITVTITDKNDQKTRIAMRCRIDKMTELEYFRHGGILQYLISSNVKINGFKPSKTALLKADSF